MNWKENFLKVAVPARVFDGVLYHDILIDPTLAAIIKSHPFWKYSIELHHEESESDILPIDLGDESV